MASNPGQYIRIIQGLGLRYTNSQLRAEQTRDILGLNHSPSRGCGGAALLLPHTLTKSHSHTSQLHTQSTENKSIHQAIKEGYTQTRHPVRVCVIQGFCPLHPRCTISTDHNVSFLSVESIVMYLSDTPFFFLFSFTRYLSTALISKNLIFINFSLLFSIFYFIDFQLWSLLFLFFCLLCI